MEQHEANSFSLLGTESTLSSAELQTILQKAITGDADPTPSTQPEQPSIPNQVRYNVSVDVSRFHDFETALKRFSSLCKKEGLMPKQRQFEAQGKRMVSRHAGRFERTVLPVSPLVSAIIKERKRKALRGELQEPSSRVKSREIAPPASAASIPAPVATPLEYPVAVSSYVSPARQRFSTGPRDEVLIIIEFMSTPPKFSIIKDEHKALIGFPFGGKDDPENGIVDVSIIAAGLREAREEFFYNLPVMLTAGEENIITTIPGPENGTVHIMHLQVPEGTPYAHGKEQTDSALATEQKIDELVRDRLILPKHKEAWGFFKEIVLLPRFLASLRNTS